MFPNIFPLAILRCQISAEIEAMAKAARSRKLQEQMPWAVQKIDRISDEILFDDGLTMFNSWLLMV